MIATAAQHWENLAIAGKTNTPSLTIVDQLREFAADEGVRLNVQEDKVRDIYRVYLVNRANCRKSGRRWYRRNRQNKA